MSSVQRPWLPLRPHLSHFCPVVYFSFKVCLWRRKIKSSLLSVPQKLISVLFPYALFFPNQISLIKSWQYDQTLCELFMLWCHSQTLTLVYAGVLSFLMSSESLLEFPCVYTYTAALIKNKISQRAHNCAYAELRSYETLTASMVTIVNNTVLCQASDSHL
jgi:hypothetical protein